MRPQTIPLEFVAQYSSHLLLLFSNETRVALVQTCSRMFKNNYVNSSNLRLALCVCLSKRNFEYGAARRKKSDNLWFSVY